MYIIQESEQRITTHQFMAITSEMCIFKIYANMNRERERERWEKDIKPILQCNLITK